VRGVLVKLPMRESLSKNLITRIAVAAVGIPAVLWISYEGGWWLFGMLGLFMIIGSVELLMGEKVSPLSPLFWYSLLTVFAIYYLFGFGLSFNWQNYIVMLSPVPFVFYLLITGMAISMGKKTSAELFERHTRLVWGVAYLGFLYSVVYAIGASSSNSMSIGWVAKGGGDSLLFLFGILWVGDTAAMGVGSWIGKHKLAPSVSPNKTVEGFVGGIAGAMLVGLLMMFWKFSQIEWYHVLIIAVGCSVFGQLGDLVESMWKRSLGLKDSSALIPGHGGVLDRFDSLLFAAPFMYAYFAYLTYLRS